MERTIYEFKSEQLTYTEDGKRRSQLTVKLGDIYNNGNIQFSIRTYTEVQSSQGLWIPESWGINREFLENRFDDLLPFIGLHGCCFDGAPLNPVSEGSYLFRTGERDKAIALLRITEDEADRLLIPAKEQEYFSFMLRKLGIIDRWAAEASRLMDWLDFYLDDKSVTRFFDQKSKSDYHRIDSKLEDIKHLAANGYYSEGSVIARFNEDRQSKLDAARKRIYENYETEVKQKELERDISLSLIDFGLITSNFIIYSFERSATFNYSHLFPLVPESEVERYIETVGSVRFPDVKFKNEKKGSNE